MMNRSTFGLGLAVAVLVGGLFPIAAPASAATVFDQLPITTPGFVPYSDVEGNSFSPNGVTTADDFVLGSAETIRSIEFHGAYYEGDLIASDAFSVLVFSNVSGTPDATPLFTSTLTNLTRTNTGQTDFGSDRYNYLADLTSPIALSAGTYWLAILNDTTGDSDIWGWTDTGASGNNISDETVTAPFDWDAPVGVESSFRLDNAVIPEPTSLALLGLGGLAMLRRTRRHA